MTVKNFLTKNDLLEALADFRLSLEKRLDMFATKEDLEQFATKSDLERFATKEDLEKFATKEDLKSLRLELKDDMKIMGETILDNVVETLDESYTTKKDHLELKSRVEQITIGI